MFEVEDRKIRELKNKTRIIRKKRFSRSRLDRYSGEILHMYRPNVGSKTSIAEILRWLRDQKRVKVVYSTLYRWLKKHGQVRKSC